MGITTHPRIVITSQELDRRLKGLDHSIKRTMYEDPLSFRPSLGNQELVEFTTLLHRLLLSEGFTTTYSRTDSDTCQHIWIELGARPSNTIRLTVRYDGWLYIDRGSDVPKILTSGIFHAPDPITAFISTLHSARHILLAVSTCRTCHYSNLSQGADNLDTAFCGKGLPIAQGCAGHRPIQQ